MLFAQACEKKGKVAFDDVQWNAKHLHFNFDDLKNDTIKRAWEIIDDTALVSGKDTDTKDIINVFQKKSKEILKKNPNSLEGEAYDKAAKALKLEDERLSKDPLY